MKQSYEVMNRLYENCDIEYWVSKDKYKRTYYWFNIYIWFICKFINLPYNIHWNGRGKFLLFESSCRFTQINIVYEPNLSFSGCCPWPYFHEELSFYFYKSEPMFTNNNENKMKSLIDTFGFPMSSAKVFDSIKANTVY